MFELLKKVFLSLRHGYSEYQTKYILGLRRALSSSTYSLYSEGLSPGVTLFSPRKQYASVSFFDFLFFLKGIKNPSSDVPLSTRSVMKRIRMGLTDELKIGSIVRGRGYKASFNREYITDKVGYM